jgi:transposase InsO family protein
MPWKECDAMSEKINFISRYLYGEKMSELCREFEISRKTGYKIVERYEKFGASAFEKLSQRPHRSPNQTPEGLIRLITDVRQTHPSWGARKIGHYLRRKRPDLLIPATSTIHTILARHGLVIKKSGRKRYKAQGTCLQKNLVLPNELWCADYKGQFRLGDRTYCYPLTITDQVSRFLLCAEAMEGTNEADAFDGFERTFKEYGLPQAIRTDNGVPFSCRGLLGLSKLSVWWLRLGIRLERISPGNPQQNGTHERMHLTLKQSVTRPPGKHILQQQEMLDDFVQVFNHERPHDGINNKVPADIYHLSERKYPDVLTEPDYADCERVLTVSSCGKLGVGGKKRVFIGEALSQQPVGLKQIEEDLWAVCFMDYELGFFDGESLKFCAQEDVFCAERPMRKGS